MGSPIQIVLGVPYNVLKFEVDGMNILLEIAIQNLVNPPPPPPPPEHSPKK